MAQLEIGIGDNKALVFHFATIRTQEYTVEPVYDSTGLHFECSRITLDIVGLVNAVTIATNKPNPIRVGAQGKVERTDPPNNGDSLPFSMYYMRDMLMQPRRSVSFVVDDTVILDLPRLVANQRLSCDARGGPLPQRATFTQITGDKTAMLSYRVVCHDTYQAQALLSNTWSISSDIDRHGFTTRTVSGRAAFRHDVMLANNLVPDDFRKDLMLPVPAGMRRVGVSVTPDANGFECSYTVVDREVHVGLGAASPTLEVNGSVTASISYPIRDLKGMIGGVVNFGNQVIKGAWDFNPFVPAQALFNSAVPTNSNVGVARATGRKNASRALLAQTAAAFLLDRFSPLLIGGAGAGVGGVIPGFIAGAFGAIPRGVVVSVTCTTNIDTDNNPYAEMRMEVLGLGLDVVKKIIVEDAAGLLNLKTDYEGLATQAMSSPALPASRGTRGSVMVRLLTQALEAPPDDVNQFNPNLPGSVPASQNAKDADRQ